MNDWLPLINTALVAVLGGGGVWLWRAERRVRNATADKVEADAQLGRVSAAGKIQELSMSLLGPLERKIQALEESNARLERKVEELQRSVDKYQENERRLQDIIETKNARIDALEAELDAAHRDRDELHREIDELKARLRAAGINGDEEPYRVIGRKLGN